MGRLATGQVIERRGKQGRTFALRFRAYGQRRYVTLGTRDEGWTLARAEIELENVLADVRRGIWQAPDLAPAEPQAEPSFHEFASEWLAMRTQEGLGERTIEDYTWALTLHLLPFFAGHRLSEITVREVDRYKTTKATEGVLSANSINKTLTRLSQVLATAVEYELIAANPAAGKRRRLKGTKPRRPHVEPEQLLTLLEASEHYLRGRGRPLMAVLAGAGLRISEATALERRDVNLAKATLTVRASKTEAGERVVDLTPALREELFNYLACSPWTRPTDLVFPTLTGKRDTRNNVRRRLVRAAVERANKKLRELGIEPIPENLGPHGLRRTFASLRHAVGDDIAYTSEQLGHEDARFTLGVYTHATKRRHRLSQAELAEFNRAIEWAQMGTNEVVVPMPVATTDNEPARELAS
jgi:integrase